MLLEQQRDDDGRKEEGPVVVFSLRRAISWVVVAGDISCVEDDALRFRQVMYVFEYIIGGLVFASAFPPSLNNPPDVSKDFGVSAPGYGRHKCEDEESESNCFSPLWRTAYWVDPLIR